MKKFIILFLVFILSLNGIFKNNIILSSAESTIVENTSNSTDYDMSDENEVQTDPKENPKHIMGGVSSEYNNTQLFLLDSIQPKLNSYAVGSGTVKSGPLNIRSGPSLSDKKVGTLNKGDYIEIYARNNNWYKILYNNQFAYVSSDYIELNIMEKGIDVSKWNNVVDWNKVKSSGVDYVIIRAGFGSSTVDEKFKSHIEGAIAAGLKIGVYWFSYATSVEKAQIEAQKCLETIKPYKDKITYPVYFDYEYDSVDYATKNKVTITKDLASKMATTFINTIKSAGYDTGIYTNQDFSNKYFNSDLLYSNNLWIAQYNSQCTFNKPYMMWQCTDKGLINGINGYVDINYTYLKSNKQDYTSNIIPGSNSNSSSSAKDGISYKTHVQTYGWLDWKSNGQTSGTTNESRRIEAIELKLNNAPSNAKILYQTHVQDHGWLDWKSNGQTSGTTNESRRVEAIRIKLENMDGYSVQYRVHVQDYGWLDWKSDGEIAGTTNESRRIEAIEVKLVKLNPIELKYKTHVQTYGWLDWKSDGQTSGTTNESRRVEAIELKLNNAPSNAKILYQTHVQDHGWLDWKSNGQTSGTTNESRRVEAIRIKLENMNGYSIKYRVHVQGYGWLDWKSDGEIAGTTNQSRRVEAIEVKLVKK